MEKTPFDELSRETLMFFLERTDFCEPFLMFGFASNIREELQKSLDKKEPQNHDKDKRH